MAAAMLYEAGDDSKCQLAVGQVVINRVRHPAFPKSICEVVFQGSDRATGCQFTFTCDGALARRYSDAAWKRAQDNASRSEEHTSELQSLMRISYAVFCLKKKKKKSRTQNSTVEQIRI